MDLPFLVRRAVPAARMIAAVLRQNRLRTVLAALRVFLGAMLLTSILHVLESVNLMMEQEARRLGSHVVTLTAGGFLRAPEHVGLPIPDAGRRHGLRRRVRDGPVCGSAG